jgi:energy-coupling factor transporter transmembrane protein EcfT
MKGSRISASLLALALVASCTTTTVTDRQMADPNERLARPDRILVHDVAATAADLHAGSVLSGKHAARSAPPTAEEIAVGRSARRSRRSS